MVTSFSPTSITTPSLTSILQFTYRPTPPRHVNLHVTPAPK
jgi:hypothetical protein